MRIAIFTSSFPVLSETFILNHVDGLRSRGHELQVFATRGAPGPAHKRALNLELVSVVRYPPKPTRNAIRRLGQGIRLAASGLFHRPRLIGRSLNISKYGRDAAVLNLLRETSQFTGAENVSFDVVHAHFGPNGLRAARLLEMGALKGPLVVTFHGYDALVEPRRQEPGFYNLLFQRAAAITVGSEFMRGQLLELGAPADRTVVIPIGIDIEAFNTEGRPQQSATTRLLSVARLLEAKGIQVALEAVALLTASGVNVEYTVIGDGPYRPELETLTRELGISGRVHFSGALGESAVQDAYRSADVFLHPATYGSDGSAEGQGLTLAEAQATRLPVVASRCGGLPEAIRDGITGYLVTPDSPDEIADRVTELARHPCERMARGEAGRQLVETRFDLQAYLSRLEDLYTGLMAA